MGLIRKFKSQLKGSEIPEELIYGLVAEEIENGRLDKGLMTKFLSQTDFDRDKAMGRYVRHRVKILKKELPKMGAVTIEQHDDQYEEGTRLASESTLIEGPTDLELSKKYYHLWYIYKEVGLPDKANEYLALHEIHKKRHRAHEESFEEDEDWENRVLCSDPSCIGVIGEDGRCGECGMKSK